MPLTQNILALDIGDTKNGVAISSGIYANEYTTIQFLNQESFLLELKKICDKEKINKIIIGLPLLEKGGEQRISKKIRLLKIEIEKFLQIPTYLEDERFTSKEAFRQLEEEGLNSKESQKRVDQRAAKIILEQYLEKDEK